jgi:hypothetical protein
MTVPFPRTVPADAPDPPTPLLDQRAARTVFARRRREGAIGYRLAVEGVYVQQPDRSETFHPWADVVAEARQVLLGGYTPPDADDDPSRREQRQQRRQDRRDDRRGGG